MATKTTKATTLLKIWPVLVALFLAVLYVATLFGRDASSFTEEGGAPYGQSLAARFPKGSEGRDVHIKAQSAVFGARSTATATVPSLEAESGYESNGIHYKYLSNLQTNRNLGRLGKRYRSHYLGDLPMRKLRHLQTNADDDNDNDDFWGLLFFSFFFCNKVGDGSYETETLGFFGWLMNILFTSKPQGKCNDLCPDLCPLGFEDFDDTSCTCTETLTTSVPAPPTATSVPSVKPTNPPSPKPSEIDVPLPPPGTLDRVFNDGSPSSLYPLDRCLGDCDSDSDCMDNLKCCQRDSTSDPPPPNCVGNTEGDTDYCYSPADGSCGDDNGGSCGGDSFRLKMYWEEGYKWQGSSSEEKYCMECEGSTCSSGDQIEIHECDSKSDCLEWHNLYVSGGQEFSQIKIADQNLCFEIVGNNRMELRECIADASSYPRQQFVALNGAFSGPGRFEIGTMFRNGCLTQQHHPRSGEVIKREDCPDTRDDDTSFWVLY